MLKKYKQFDLSGGKSAYNVNVALANPYTNRIYIDLIRTKMNYIELVRARSQTSDWVTL